MCRIPLDPDMDKRTRALSAEQAIEAMDLNFSCRNHECTFSGQKKDLEKHEETCEYDERWEDVDDSDEDSSQYEDGSSDESDNSEYDNEDSEDSSSLSSLASITASRIRSWRGSDKVLKQWGQMAASSVVLDKFSYHLAFLNKEPKQYELRTNQSVYD